MKIYQSQIDETINKASEIIKSLVYQSYAQLRAEGLPHDKIINAGIGDSQMELIYNSQNN